MKFPTKAEFTKWLRKQESGRRFVSDSLTFAESSLGSSGTEE